MKPVLFLRIASVLTFVHAALHGINMIFGKPEPRPQRIAATAMQANQFPLMGSMRSFWDFYMGMGLAGSISLIVEALIMWQLASLARKKVAGWRAMAATFLVGYVVLAVNSFTYFFAPPVITELLIALFLGIATVKRDAAGANSEL